MSYYDLFGMSIKTNLDLSNYSYSSDKKSHDFEMIYDKNLFIGGIPTNANSLYSRFVIGDSVPCEEFFRIGMQSYMLQWAGRYRFYFDPKEKQVIVNGPLDEEFFAVFFSKTLAFLLYLKDFSLLHGSAVRYQEKTIGFIGESGSGKSTCASLCLLDGGTMITDDVIAIHPAELRVRSGLPSARLSASSPLFKKAKQSFSEVDKLRLDLSNGMHFSETSAIDCIFFLEVNDKKGFTSYRLNGSEAMLQLLAHVYGRFFLRDVFDNHLYAENMRVFSNLVKTVPMVKIYRRSDAQPDEFFEEIQSVLANFD